MMANLSYKESVGLRKREHGNPSSKTLIPTQCLQSKVQASKHGSQGLWKLSRNFLYFTSSFLVAFYHRYSNTTSFKKNETKQIWIPKSHAYAKLFPQPKLPLLESKSYTSIQYFMHVSLPPWSLAWLHEQEKRFLPSSLYNFQISFYTKWKGSSAYIGGQS